MKKFILMAALLFCGCFIVTAQSICVKGVVYDEYGTVPGIVIFVQETRAGVVTDIDGRFSIRCNPGNKLVFSGLGYKDQVITVNSTTNVVKVTMEVDDDAIIVTPSNCDYAYIDSQKSPAALFENKKLSYCLQELNA